MRVHFQVLTPGVQDPEEADVCSEVLRVACHFEHGCGARTVEQVIDDSLVPQGQRGEFVGKREDDVEVGNGQQFCRARLEPLGTRVPLALGAVPVAACNGAHTIMQSVFSVVARRRDASGMNGLDGRAGALKTDWAKPLHDACPMGIEWLA